MLRFLNFLNNPHVRAFNFFSMALLIAAVIIPYCMGYLDCSATTTFDVDTVTMNSGGLDCLVQGSLQGFQTRYNFTISDKGLCSTYAPKSHVSACYNFFDTTRTRVTLRPMIWTTPLLVVGGSIASYLALLGMGFEVLRPRGRIN